MGKVLVQGSPIHGSNGIMFDDNDLLYIASGAGREILVMDPKSGRILDKMGPDEGVEGPDDLIFGPESGWLCQSGWYLHDVVRRVCKDELICEAAIPCDLACDASPEIGERVKGMIWRNESCLHLDDDGAVPLDGVDVAGNPPRSVLQLHVEASLDEVLCGDELHDGVVYLHHVLVVELEKPAPQG